MRRDIKERIEQIRRGEVPEGYQKNKAIGLAPNDWTTKPIGSAISFFTERSTQKNQYPVMTSSREGLFFQTDYFEDQITRDENTGYNIIPYGYVTYRSRSDDGSFTFNQNTLVEKGIVSCFYPVFTVNENLANIHYLLLYLNHYAKEQILSEVVGTSQLVLSEKKLSSLNFPYPSIAEQTKVAEILTYIDKVLSLKQQLIAEKRKQKTWLMQNLLDPDSGVRLPGFEGSAWRIKTLGDIGDNIIGLTYEPSCVQDEGTLVLRSSNIYNGRLSLNDNVYVSCFIPAKLQIQAGDILICARNGSRRLIGKATLIEEKIDNCTFGAFMTVYRCNNPRFVSYLMQTPAYREQVEKSLGARINQLTSKELKAITLSFPVSEVEQAAIANVLSTADREIDLLEQELAQWQTKKKALMQMLLTGIVRV